MKGTIRARGKCPKCHGLFIDISQGISMHRHLGIICRSCIITPQRLFIDLHHQGRRIRIFSDKSGQPLDSYQRAVNLLFVINHEIANYSFDPLKYIKKEQGKYWINSLLDRFYDFKIDSIAPSYKRHYKKHVKLAKDFFNTKDIRKLKKSDVINYKDHIAKEFNYSEKSVKNVLDLFKTFLRYCKNNLEIISSVPAFPAVEVPEYHYKWLSQDDQLILFEHIPDQDKPIMAFLMLHGCLPSEARALRCKNADLDAQAVSISATFSVNVYREKRKGRRSKSVTIPIHPEMYDYVADRVKYSLPEAYIFVNPRTGRYYTNSALDRVWFKARKDAGLGNDLRLYDATRHSFASQLVNTGTSIFKVSKLLGHSSVRITEKYAHGHVARLRTDLSKLHLEKQDQVVNISGK
jgi:integrase